MILVQYNNRLLANETFEEAFFVSELVILTVEGHGNLYYMVVVGTMLNMFVDDEVTSTQLVEF